MIPLSVPELAGNEWQYVKDCIDTGWVSSSGDYVGRFEDAMLQFTGASHAVACMNGTSALHLCLRVLGVQDDDYVVLPNITFVASANAITYDGAEPILIDCEPDTWQMDIDLLEAFLRDRTRVDRKGTRRLIDDDRPVRAIMPVHVLGSMADMTRLCEVAKKYGLTMIEDATEALGSSQLSSHAGTFGVAGCFSFNGNKIVTTGGGGMIVTEDEALAKRTRHLSTQAKVSPDEYIHDEIGFNYRLVNVLAAIGLAQMEQLPGFIQRKREIDAYYKDRLTGVGDIEFQSHTEGTDPNCWLFTFSTSRMRTLIDFLRREEIQTRPFWKPMNQLAMFGHVPYVTDSDRSSTVYDTCISIPCSSGLMDAEMERVAKSIRAFYAK